MSPLKDLFTIPEAYNIWCKVAIYSVFAQPRPEICKKACLFDLELEMVNNGSSALWNEFIDRYHYLGYKPLPGAQIRYFEKSEVQILALLGFGATAWKTALRDTCIGWDTETRKKHLHLVINNARFLILPWIKSKNMSFPLILIAILHVIGDTLKSIPM